MELEYYVKLDFTKLKYSKNDKLEYNEKLDFVKFKYPKSSISIPTYFQNNDKLQYSKKKKKMLRLFSPFIRYFILYGPAKVTTICVIHCIIDGSCLARTKTYLPIHVCH